ncbi:MAG: hypothetical protein PHT94_02855 [Candidatus Nanoarchaeia archaeon]|nr:hypothetical protein [Candidatus Nanoarchaeia archaeon]
MMYKKGLSPLIASILLIALSITVVALMTVMSGNIVDDSMNEIDTSKKQISCAQIDIVLKQYKGRDMVCYNDIEGNDTTEFIIFLQNVGFENYYGAFIEIFEKDLSIKSFNDYNNLLLEPSKNLVLKYNITDFNVSKISDVYVKIGLKDKNKETYFCPTGFSISSSKIIKCENMYK